MLLSLFCMGATFPEAQTPSTLVPVSLEPLPLTNGSRGVWLTLLFDDPVKCPLLADLGTVWRGQSLCPGIFQKQ